MKDVMRARFVPTHYSHNLFKKLQLLKQGTKSVEEYYKEMEIAMIRANVKEDDEQTMARFLNGLNHPIKKIADFQPYSNLLELVYQATKAERQVQEDYKYSKYSSKTYGSYTQASTTTITPSMTRATSSTGDKSSTKQLSTSSSRLPNTTSVSKQSLRHRQLLRMPTRQAISSASLARAEATSLSSAQLDEQ